LALGAQRRDVLGLILRQGLKLTLCGVGVGLLASWAVTRLLTKLLYSVSATDPSTFGGVALLLTVVALIACLLLASAPSDEGRSVGGAQAGVKFVVPPLGGCALRRCVTNSLGIFFIESRDSATSKGRERQ